MASALQSAVSQTRPGGLGQVFLRPRLEQPVEVAGSCAVPDAEDPQAAKARQEFLQQLNLQGVRWALLSEHALRDAV